MLNFRLTISVLFFILLVGCGGGSSGGGGGGTSTDDDSGGVPPPSGNTGGTTATNPDVALLFVSGHNGSPSRSYLHLDIGPALMDDVRAAGYSVSVSYFVDHYETTDMPGYAELVATLKQIRNDWVFGQTVPTKVVVVAHSHGGVWATAAIREVPSLPIHLQVALDHSSYGWSFVGHDVANDLIGGDPRDAYTISTLTNCPDAPNAPSESGSNYDLEDVVFPNVYKALEVRSGDAPFIEHYDERWNCRVDGTSTGLYCHYSDTDHSEVHETTGPTYAGVSSWVVFHLATP